MGGAGRKNVDGENERELLMATSSVCYLTLITLHCYADISTQHVAAVASIVQQICIFSLENNRLCHCI